MLFFMMCNIFFGGEGGCMCVVKVGQGGYEPGGLVILCGVKESLYHLWFLNILPYYILPVQ